MAQTVIREAGYTGTGTTSFSNPNPVTVYGRIVVQLGTVDNNKVFTAAASSSVANMTASANSTSSSATVALTFPGEENEYSGRGVFSYGLAPAQANLAAGTLPPGWLEVPFELADSVRTIAPQKPSSSDPTIGPPFVWNGGDKIVDASFKIYNPNVDLGDINIVAYGFESKENTFSVRQVPSDTVLKEKESTTFFARFALNDMQANLNPPQEEITITGWVEWTPNWTRTVLIDTQRADGFAVGKTTLFSLVQPEYSAPVFTST